MSLRHLTMIHLWRIGALFEHINDTELHNCLKRFLDKIDDYSSENSCWNWLAYKDWQGYGTFSFRGVKWYAHRWAYWLQYTTLTDGLELDHLCGNKSCVNPLHLSEVKHATNIWRGEIYNRNKTYCSNGHAYTEDNTYHFDKFGKGKERVCKACRHDRYVRLKGA